MENLDSSSSFYDANITVSELDGNLHINDVGSTTPKSVWNPYSISSTPVSSQFFTLPMLSSAALPTADVTVTNQPDSSNSVNNDELMRLLSQIPILQSTCSSLLNKVSSLESTCSDLQVKCTVLQCNNEDLQNQHAALQKEFSDYRKSNDIRWNNGEQYTRKNSLLLHGVRDVPLRVNGTKFSMFVAHTLTKLFPKFPLSHHDIDTSHILFYEYVGNQRHPVIVVKFVNRDLRNDIRDDYILRDFRRSSFRISEHLTDENRSLLNTAADASDEAWSDQGKLYAAVNGKTKQICQIDDLVLPDDDAATTSSHPAASNENSAVTNSASMQFGNHRYPPVSNRLRFFRNRRNPRDSPSYYNNNSKKQNYTNTKRPYKSGYKRSRFDYNNNNNFFNQNAYNNRSSGSVANTPSNGWPILPNPGLSSRPYPFPPPPPSRPFPSPPPPRPFPPPLPMMMNQGNPVFFSNTNSRLPPGRF